jgi:hypothetical protein
MRTPHEPMQRDGVCDDCGAALTEWHTLGCPNEQCPYCGDQLGVCDCEPPLDDRIPWQGNDVFLSDARRLGWFVREVNSRLYRCSEEARDAFPDFDRLLGEATWNRKKQRFEPIKPSKIKEPRTEARKSSKKRKK